MNLSDIIPLPFGLGPRRAVLMAVTLPRAARPDRRLRQPTPRTIAPPVSGAMVLTADNRPQDPRAWQNEPGPGAGETSDLAIVRRPIQQMEAVPRVTLPAA